jgi:hypothetical protein
LLRKESNLTHSLSIKGSLSFICLSAADRRLTYSICPKKIKQNSIYEKKPLNAYSGKTPVLESRDLNSGRGS